MPQIPYQITINQMLVIICAVMGLIVLTASVLRIVNFRHALPLGLEFWMAAGLIRLSDSLSWKTILTAATLILIRKAAVFGIGLTKTRAS